MVEPQWGSFKTPESYKQEMDPNKEFQEQGILEEDSQEIPGGLKDEKQPEAEQPQWGSFKTPTTYQKPEDEPSDEGWFDYIGRNLLANSSRVVEQVAGRYGNVEKFAKDVLVNLPSTAGILGEAISSLMGQENWERMVRGPKGQEQMLPTSNQLKELSEKASGGLTKAKTSGEKRFQGYTEDIASTLRGGMGNQSTTRLTANHLLIPSVANFTKNLVQDIGFGEDKANMAKLAVWVPLALATNINAPEYASNLMNQGRSIPQNVVVNTPRIQQSLNTVMGRLQYSDPRSALAREQLQNIHRDIANGQTSVRSFMGLYDGINASKRSRGLFEMGSGDRIFARSQIDLVRDAVRQEIEIAGSAFPQNIQPWLNGVQAWSVIHRSNSITNFVKDLAQGPYSKALIGPSLGLFTAGSAAAVKAPFVTGTLTGSAAAAYKAGNTAYRMFHDENLRNYYFQALSAATQENAPAFINNYNKMNAILEKSEPVKKKSKSKK